jgi:ATP-dependent Zn protease
LAYAHGACIVFIDELDVIGRGRHFNSFGGGEETNSTQNQLLVEMDGLGEKAQNVVVVGATNAAEGVLDKALLRPGRFDRKIYIDLPNLNERVNLFRYYLKKIQHDAFMDIGRLGRRCVGKSPADIMNITKEAGLIATRNKRTKVEYKDITEALERIDLGIAHPLSMSQKNGKIPPIMSPATCWPSTPFIPRTTFLRRPSFTGAAPWGWFTTAPGRTTHVQPGSHVGRHQGVLGGFMGEKSNTA